VGALLADHDAGTRRLDRDAALPVRTLDHDLGDRGLLQRPGELLADRHVLVQKLAVVVLARIPARIPGAIDPETQPDRIDLLTHIPGPLRLKPYLFNPWPPPLPQPRAPRW